MAVSVRSMTPRRSDQSGKVREERQKQLLEAALGLFAEKGFHNTTVAEIAARAGVSQGAVYWYFDSKDELFEAAFAGTLKSLLEPFFEVLADEARPAGERLMSVAEYSLDLFALHADLAFILLQIMSTQELARILTYDFREFYREFGKLLMPLFEELGDPDPEATAAMFMAVLDGLMVQGILGPDLFDRDRVLAQIGQKFVPSKEEVS